MRLAKGEDIRIRAGKAFVEEVLGPPSRKKVLRDRDPKIGVAMGLAWTPAGGDAVFVVSTRMPGTGQLHVTGSAGDIMRESVATVAVT